MLPVILYVHRPFVVEGGAVADQCYGRYLSSVKPIVKIGQERNL